MENKGTKSLETTRLILRQFKSDDAEDMFNNWASDSEVTKFLTWQAHSDINVTLSIINSWISRYSDDSFYNWAIVLKETNKVIGNISVVKITEIIKAVDIGYCLGKPWWGKGIMPEALKKVIDFLFLETDVNRIAASHDIKNPKSGRVMQKAGMQKEGIIRAGGINNCGICDMVCYSILRSDIVCESK